MRAGLAPERLQALYRRMAPRYDLQHALITAGRDGAGRKLLVRHGVRAGDRVLDCGAGTCAAGLLAAAATGSEGRVTMLDLSPAMLARGRRKAEMLGVEDRVSLVTGDLVRLPFADSVFDVVISSYSLCPVYDPAAGVLELYRVVRPGGRIAVAHSAAPENRLVRRLAGLIEDWAWRFPGLSMGCRWVEILPTLTRAGARVIYSRTIGVPLWPFLVFVAVKPPDPPDHTE